MKLLKALGIVAGFLRLVTCECRSSEAAVIPRKHWFTEESVLGELITNGTLTGDCATQGIFVFSNDTTASTAKLNELLQTGQGGSLVQFTTPLEGSKFEAEHILERLMMTLLYASDRYNSFFPLTLSIDLVYPSTVKLAQLLAKLERLGSHLKFKFGQDSVKLNFRLLTRVNQLALHLLATSSNELTLVHGKTKAQLVTALGIFFREDCPLCREFLFPSSSSPYNLVLKTEPFSASDCLLVSC